MCIFRNTSGFSSSAMKLEQEITNEVAWSNQKQLEF